MTSVSRVWRLCMVPGGPARKGKVWGYPKGEKRYRQ